MMKLLTDFLLFVFFISFFTCCKNTGDDVYMAFDNVVYISKFPKEIQLNKVDPMDVDLMGAVDLFAQDSIVIFKYYNMDYFWGVFTVDSFLNKGYYLSKGHGPDEFSSLPSNEYFANDGGICQFWDSGQNKMYNININSTLDNGILNIDTVIDLKIKSYAHNCVQMDDSTYFVVQGSGNSQHRSLLISGVFHELEYLQPLNDVKVQNNLNTISGVRVCNKNKHIVVEGMLYLNQLNLYSLKSDTINKTICVGDKLSNVATIDKASKKQWKRYYGPIIVTDEYFAALYYNSSYEDFLRGNMKKVDVQFFDLKGNPMLNISVPYSVTGFFIHRNKHLYVLSIKGEVERIYKYDISQVLQNVLKKT